MLWRATETIKKVKVFLFFVILNISDCVEDLLFQMCAAHQRLTRIFESIVAMTYRSCDLLFWLYKAKYIDG